jgi:ubiquinone/menaquinone biosynthesis C-methylase UbiE
MAAEPDPGAVSDLNREVHAIWENKAEFWDERMADGNVFQRLLVGPATERLLRVQPGQLVLEIACGNGVFSRRLAALGAWVVATDFSARFLDLARARSSEYNERITYQLIDATDEGQLLALGEERFDAAVCNMGLMDMSTIDPLLRALTRLLKPDACFVFSVLHPAFNIPGATSFLLEKEERDATLVETRHIKISNYLHVPPLRGVGMPGEPMPHLYFHRTISGLLGSCIAAGFVVDGLEEPAFGPEDRGASILGWDRFDNIPPVLVTRVRCMGSGEPTS